MPATRGRSPSQDLTFLETVLSEGYAYFTVGLHRESVLARRGQTSFFLAEVRGSVAPQGMTGVAFFPLVTRHYFFSALEEPPSGGKDK